MVFKKQAFFLILTYIFICVNGDIKIGDACHNEQRNITGECVLLKDCNSAIKDIQDKKHPQICGFHGLVPVVCCPRLHAGLIAEKKCWEYSEAVYIIVPPTNVFVNKEPLNISICSTLKDELYPSGDGCLHTKAKSFPHMAVLGYGRANNKKWKCSGTLISEKFILTAAHCLNVSKYGEVKFIRLSELDLTALNDAEPQDFYVKEIFKHPEYSAPSRYNDIALLEMDRPTKFNEYIRPACLQVAKDIPNSQYTATGWGQIDVGGERLSEYLQKIQKYHISEEDCIVAFSSRNGLPKGIDFETQLCAKNRGPIEVCEMDTGGPLQIDHPQAFCMYRVIGITSTEKFQSSNSAYIYTRVSHYIDWIERIVWKSYFTNI